MSETWMYDGFPLKRADQETRGDDYQYVIQSLDAAIRHVFGFQAGVSIPPSFSIDANGNVEILESFSVGSSITITNIVEEIESIALENEGDYLPNVTAIRAYVTDYVDNYLITQDQFVLRTGDTMSGQLVADGGITAAVDLEIENALFTSDARLDGTNALMGGGRDLVKWDDAVIVGDAGGMLQLTGSGSRPTYKGNNIAFVQDIIDAAAATGIDYVPEIGGTFTGLVNFDSGLQFPAGAGAIFEYDSGGQTAVFAYVFDDATGEIEVGSGPGGVRIANILKLDDVAQVEIGAGWVEAIEVVADEINFGDVLATVNLRGSAGRPTYNGDELALFSDVSETYLEGDGIVFTSVGPNVSEIGIAPAGLTPTFFPASDPGYYLRLEPVTGNLIWDDLAIVAGTGIATVVDPGDRFVTINIDNLGVDTAQLQLSSVDDTILAPDSVTLEKIAADRGAFPDPGIEYSLVQLDGNLEWHRGGAGALVSTAEIDSTNLSCSAGGASNDVTLSNGPYMIYLITGSNGSSFACSFNLYVEGEIVYTSGWDSGDPPEVRTEEAVPIFAAKEFTLELTTHVSSSYTSSVRAYWMRMAP